MNNPYIDSLKTVFEKDENEIILAPLVISKVLSFNKPTFKIAEKVQQYAFGDKKIFDQLVSAIIPKQRTPFIKYLKSQKEEEEEFDFFFEKYQKLHGYSKKEMKEYKPIILDMLKKDMKGTFMKYGIEEKYFKRYKIKLEFKIDEKPQGVNLSKFW